MQDVMQEFANKFCAEFGLAIVPIRFALEFSMDDLRMYSMLTCPQKNAPEVKPLIKNEKKMIGLLKEGRTEEAKDILWKKVVTNPNLGSFISRFYLKDLEAFRAAIDICEGRKPIVSNKEQLEYAEEIANRIRKFHLQGKVLPEFRNLYIKAYYAAKEGKMPLVSFNKKDVEAYIHETIHYILFENKLYSGHNPFDEGLCTFLHIRSRGSGVTGAMYGFFSGSHHYMNWAKFFFKKFAGMGPNPLIGRYLRLRSNFENLLQEFKREYG